MLWSHSVIVVFVKAYVNTVEQLWVVRVSKTVEQTVVFEPGLSHISYNGTMEVTLMPCDVGDGVMMLAEGTEKVYDCVAFQEVEGPSGELPTTL